MPVCPVLVWMGESGSGRELDDAGVSGTSQAEGATPSVPFALDASHVGEPHARAGLSDTGLGRDQRGLGNVSGSSRDPPQGGECCSESACWCRLARYKTGWRSSAWGIECGPCGSEGGDEGMGIAASLKRPMAQRDGQRHDVVSERVSRKTRRDAMELRVELDNMDRELRGSGQREGWRSHVRRERPRVLWIPSARKRWAETIELCVEVCRVQHKKNNWSVFELPIGLHAEEKEKQRRFADEWEGCAVSERWEGVDHE